MSKGARWFFLAVLVLASPAGSLWAQQGIGDLQTAYEARKITILPEEATPEYLWWIVNQGFQRIDEAKFLNLAGYPEEAAVSARRKATRTAITVGSIALAVGGGLLAMDALLVPTLLTGGLPNIPEMAVGLGLTCVSGIASMFILMRLPIDTVPHGRAVQIARDYNDQLIDTINEELSASGPKS